MTVPRAAPSRVPAGPGRAVLRLVAVWWVMGLLFVVAGVAQAQPTDDTGEAPAPGEPSPTRPVQPAEAPPPLARPTRAVELEAMGEAALREQGWVFDARTIQQGSATGVLLALSAGSLWHGFGHFWIGDRTTARRLAALEGIGVAMLLSGWAMQAGGGGRDGWQAGGRALVVPGAGAFLVSWLADGLGTLKGTADGLPTNSAEVPGLSVEVLYSLIPDRSLGTTNFGVVRLPLYLSRWVLVPEAELATDLDLIGLGVYGGHRWPLSRRFPQAFLETGAGVRDEVVRSSRSGRTLVGGRLMMSWDMGALASHLDGLVWRTAIEGVMETQTFGSGGWQRLVADQRQWHVPVEFSAGANVGTGIHLSAGYRMRRDTLVGAASSRFGSVWGRASFAPVGRLGFELMLERGAFSRVWLGLRWVLVRPAAPG